MRILSHFLLFFSRNARFFPTFLRELTSGCPESEKRGIFFVQIALVNENSAVISALIWAKKGRTEKGAPNKPGWSVRGTIPGVTVTIRDGCYEQ